MYVRICMAAAYLYIYIYIYIYIYTKSNSEPVVDPTSVPALLGLGRAYRCLATLRGGLSSAPASFLCCWSVDGMIKCSI